MAGYDMCLEEMALQYEPHGQHSPVRTLITLLLVNTCVFVLHDLVSRSGSGQLLDVILSMISTPNSGGKTHEPGSGNTPSAAASGPDILSAWKSAKQTGDSEGAPPTANKKSSFFN